jgi:hypothetical protein
MDSDKSMAIIKIGNVKVTPEKAIDYSVSDKKSLEKKDDVKDSKEYVTRDKKDGTITYKTLNTSMYCSIDNAHKEWESVRSAFGKNDKILMFHVKQNFGIDLDPKIAHEIGCKLANELFDDFQCIVSTHTNTDYTHNHIIFNSVSFKTGNKYYDTLGSYKKMRQVSDRLCEEYGLPVLEDTKDFKLVKFVGADGKTKYYEPTKRKDEIRKGEFSNSNDYRNTDAYSQVEEFRMSNREVIKNDIDKLLPTVNSYNELLEKLQSVGYQIRSKKVNGDWLKNVAFKAPTQDRFSRDSSLGESYTREYLTNYLSERCIDESIHSEIDNRVIDDNDVVSISVSAEYKYGAIDIHNLNEIYRKKKDKDKLIKRSDVERIIVVDTKRLNKELESKYWDSIKYIREGREQLLKNKRSQYLLDCINSNLKTLQFVEQKNIQSFNQINAIVDVLYSKRNQAQSQLHKIKTMLKSANESVVMIEKYNRLKSQIELMKNDSDYSKFDLDDDMALLNTYETILSKKNMIDPIQQKLFIEKVQRYNDSFEELSNALKTINSQIKEYDDCVYTINRIDKDGMKKYESEINQYYETKKDNIEKSKKSNSRDER